MTSCSRQKYADGEEIFCSDSFSCFREAKVTDPELSAKYLALHAFGKKSLAEFTTISAQNFSKAQMRLFTKAQNFFNVICGGVHLSSRVACLMEQKLCKQRLERVPLQYLIGEWDFRNLTLKLKRPVFIPRYLVQCCIVVTGNGVCIRASQRFITTFLIPLQPRDRRISLPRGPGYHRIATIARPVPFSRRGLRKRMHISLSAEGIPGSALHRHRY
jgi:hypothetical protein